MMSSTQAEGLLAPRSSSTRISVFADGFEDFHFCGFALRVVASLNFLQQLAVIAENSLMAATQ